MVYNHEVYFGSRVVQTLADDNVGRKELLGTLGDGAVEVFIPGHLDTGLAPYPFNIQRPLRVIFGTIQSPRHV